ncbi:MAG TPA: DUF3124 domain-containing protein [Rhodocyclaceae bacterium]|nr:DUF3124 domain-containing protein [Rhodocyclaceae bacterium]
MKIASLFCALLFALQGALAQEARPLSRGQTLYLPVYSHMLYGNVSSKGQASRVLLSAMVSIRNTDAKRPIRVLSARYYDTGGRFLREYVPAAQTIPPMGTVELFVELNDESGGSGANFVINWEAAQPVNPPLVEALHANMDSGKAVILTTQAVPVLPE